MNKDSCLERQLVSGDVPAVGDVLTFDATPNGPAWQPKPPAPPIGPAAIGLDIVYRPGAVGPLPPNVFPTWTGAWTAASLLAGPVNIAVDDSIVTPAPIDPGAWDMRGEIGIVGDGPFGHADIEIPNGAQLQNLALLDSAILDCDPTAIPSLLWTGPSRFFAMRNEALINNNTGTIPVADVSTILQIVTVNSEFSTSTAAEVFNLLSGGLFIFASFTQILPVSKLVAAGGAGTQIIYLRDATSDVPIPPAYAGALTIGHLPGPLSETVTLIGNGAYTVDAAYLAGTGPADIAIFASPVVGGNPQIILPDPTLASNIGRRMRICDANGGSLVTPIHLTPSGAFNLNGANATKNLSSAWGQWIVISDGTQWMVAELAGI